MKSADAAAAMDRALALGFDQLGRTAPNPAVGCVIAGPQGFIAGGATADHRSALAAQPKRLVYSLHSGRSHFGMIG